MCGLSTHCNTFAHKVWPHLLPYSAFYLYVITYFDMSIENIAIKMEMLQSFYALYTQYGIASEYFVMAITLSCYGHYMTWFYIIIARLVLSFYCIYMITYCIFLSDIRYTQLYILIMLCSILIIMLFVTIITVWLKLMVISQRKLFVSCSVC